MAKQRINAECIKVDKKVLQNIKEVLNATGFANDTLAYKVVFQTVLKTKKVNKVQARKIYEVMLDRIVNCMNEINLMIKAGTIATYLVSNFDIQKDTDSIQVRVK